MNPDLLQAYVALGFMCSREGRREEGIQAYDEALRISPQNMESLIGAATLNEQAGNLARAVKLAHPEDVLTRSFWIWCLYELGDPDAATVTLQPLPDGWQDRVELWIYRARAHYELGQWDEAIECCRQALARVNFDRQAHFQLARALRRVGQIGDSQKHNQFADELRLAEEKRLSLFEDVTVARRSRATPDDCRRFAELCQTTGLHRLAREWARFAMAGGDAPSMELLERMPLAPAAAANTVLGGAATAKPGKTAGVPHAQ